MHNNFSMFECKISEIIELRMKARRQTAQNSNYYKKYLIYLTKASDYVEKKTHHFPNSD